MGDLLNFTIYNISKYVEGSPDIFPKSIIFKCLMQRPDRFFHIISERRSVQQHIFYLVGGGATLLGKSSIRFVLYCDFKMLFKKHFVGKLLDLLTHSPDKNNSEIQEGG